MIIARVQVYKDPEDQKQLDRLSKMLHEFEPGGPRLAIVLRRTLVLGLLRSVRQRFLARLRRALTIYRHNEPSTVKAAQTTARGNHRMFRAVELAYARLDDAYLAGSASAIGDARQRIQRAQGRLQAYLDSGRQDKKRSFAAGRLTKLAVAAGIMRARMQEVLREITDTSNLTEPTVITLAGTKVAFVAAGSVAKLDRIKTPSATAWLSKATETKSEMNILWRHAELGTGIYARTAPGGTIANDEMPSIAVESQAEMSSMSQKQPWRFGGSGELNGILLAGSHPMEFLTEGSGRLKPPAVHTLAALAAFQKAMDEMLTLE